MENTLGTLGAHFGHTLGTLGAHLGHTWGTDIIPEIVSVVSSGNYFFLTKLYQEPRKATKGQQMSEAESESSRLLGDDSPKVSYKGWLTLSLYEWSFTYYVGRENWWISNV